MLGPSLGRGTWTPWSLVNLPTCKTNPFHIGPVSLVQFSNLFQQLGRLLRSKVDVCKVLRCADAVLARVVVAKQRLDGVRSEQGVRHERTRQPANHESTLRLHNQGHYVQNILQLYILYAFSALTVLVGWQEGCLACKKTEWWGAGMVICLERTADLHTAQLMPLPLTVSCFSKIQIGFTFLVPAHPGSPVQRAVKRVCVCDVCRQIPTSVWRASHASAVWYQHRLHC